MKKTAMLSFFSFFLLNAFSATELKPVKEFILHGNLMKADDGNMIITPEDYLKLTPGSYKQLTGRKMTLKEKITLAIGKKSLKKIINREGNAKLRKGIFGRFQWHWGGFALGFFLSFLGPIVALFFNDDYKWDRFWSALHTALWVAVLLTAILAAMGL